MATTLKTTKKTTKSATKRNGAAAAARQVRTVKADRKRVAKAFELVIAMQRETLKELERY